jgi:pSer/pThr/pTyr-binding forkhead associated (FHA) protein
MTEYDPLTAGAEKLLRRARESRRHSLEQIGGEGAPRQIVLEGGQTVMGSDPGAHIHLASKNVSPKHAFFKMCGTDCVLIDNDSSDGVFLNSVRIHSAVLHDGDLIQAAGSLFVYYEG